MPQIPGSGDYGAGIQRLIGDEQFVAVIGNVATPTTVAVLPIANRSKTPFYGAFTGAGVLRKTPPDRYVINYRASYAEETAAMVECLIEHLGLKPAEIAFFTQRDAYGDACFLNVSFVGAAPLAAALVDKGDGVIVTQVVPHYDSDVPVVREYRQALAAWRATAVPTFGSLEGYVAARILLRALNDIQEPITRESVVEALEGLGEFDIGLGVPPRLAADEHQASHTVWPTILRGGRIQPLDWAELGASGSRAGP